MEVIAIKPRLIFTPKEVKDFNKRMAKVLGKEKGSIFPVTSQLLYINGIKEIDKREDFKDEICLNVFMYEREDGINFNVVYAKIVYSVFVLNNEISKIYFVDGEEIIKQKSVIKRGIAGALIAGSIGAIVGGLSGLQEVKKQNKYMVIETQEGKIIFECTAGIYSLEKEFKSIFKEKVVTTEDIKKEQDKEFLNNI